MSSRARPEGCCPLKTLAPLPEVQRDDMVAALKAVADPTRLEILRLVNAQAGPTCVCDIVEHFDLSQPTISHHLKILLEAGFLEMSRVGVWSFYAPSSRGRELLARAAEIVATPERTRRRIGARLRSLSELQPSG
jgi:ArsR family transcriptional regulator